MLQRAISMENPFLWKISLANEKILATLKNYFKISQKGFQKPLK